MMTAEKVSGRFIRGMLLPDSFNVEECKKEILKQAKKAITAIVEHDKKSEKKKLFPEESAGLFVRFGLKRLRTRGSCVNSIVRLRNPERLPENTSVCLILPDFNHKKADRHDPDVDKHARRWADILHERYGLNGKNITKIYTFIQLKREFPEPKDREKFLNTYDVIMVQKKFYRDVVPFLGAACRRPSKYPIKICTAAPEFRDMVVNANSFVNILCIPNQMDVEVRFGNLYQGVDKLLENFEDVLNKAANCLPGGLFNVQVVRMKTGDGKPLPVYVDFGSSNDIILAEPKKEPEPIVDECSTLPEGLKVKVLPSGNVQILTEDSEEKVFYPTVDDEWEAHDDLKPTMSKEKLIKKLAQQREHKRRHRKRYNERMEKFFGKKRKVSTASED